MLLEIPADLGFGAGAVTQEEQRLLERPFSRILGLQLLNFLFIQLLADPQPRGSDAFQPEGEFPIEVDVHPIGAILLNFDRSNFSHLTHTAERPSDGFGCGEVLDRLSRPKVTRDAFLG